MLQSERGVSSVLTSILSYWKDRTFCLTASLSARREDHFQKNFVQNGQSFLKFPSEVFLKFPSDFVKLGSEILYLFLAEKWSFILFVAICNTSSDFGLLFWERCIQVTHSQLVQCNSVCSNRIIGDRSTFSLYHVQSLKNEDFETFKTTLT